MAASEVSATGDRRAGSLRGELAELPTEVWLAVGSFVNRFGSFVVPFLVLYLTHRGYSGSDAAGAVSAYAVGKIAAGPFGGLLTERLGARIAVVTSMLGSAAATVALGTVSGLEPIFVMAALTGLVSEAYRPATSVLITGVPAGFAMLAVAHTIVLLVVAVTVWSLGDLAQWPVAADRTLQLAPPDFSGRYAGARSFCYGVALLLAPLIGTALYQVRPTILWISCAATGIVAAMIVSVRNTRSP